MYALSLANHQFYNHSIIIDERKSLKSMQNDHKDADATFNSGNCI